VAIRIDWEQGKRYKELLGRIPGTGCQTLHDREARPLSYGLDAFASRYNRPLTTQVLEEVAAKFPAKPDVPLRMDWFWWPTAREGMWPASADDISNYARTPRAVVEGPLPEALGNPDFLRWHVRQFIWTRGSEGGESRITVKRVREGLKPGLSTEIATLPATSLAELGKGLDAAWLAYMKDRPRTAKGYSENPAGKMFARVEAHMVGLEDAIEAAAAKGTLLAPGRRAGESPPYLR
jgi:hypothetical protein